ncbi:MAG: glycosyltransferase family 2 protein [Acidimicrobiales bacterium]
MDASSSYDGVQADQRPNAPDDLQPSLSIIIPVFNGEGWVGRCLAHLAAATSQAEFSSVEVLLIDDGSTDRTLVEAATALHDEPDIALRTFSQPNSGRFAARRLGLENAKYDFVLFIDARVFIDESALAFVAPLLNRPDQQVWTSHVEAATADNPIAGFWQAIEHIAWRRYFKSPRTMSFGIDEFDYFPKGTTALIAAKEMLIEAFDAFEPTVTDWHKVNDDTAVLRWVAERTPINISPHYSSTYNARTNLVEFLKHAEHRGTVLIDGYLRLGTRFAGPIVGVLVLTPVLVWFVLRHPVRAVMVGVAGSVTAAAGAKSLGVRKSDALIFGTLAMPFGVAYLTGMWRGVLLRISWLRQRRRGPVG